MDWITSSIGWNQQEYEGRVHYSKKYESGELVIEACIARYQTMPEFNRPDTWEVSFDRAGWRMFSIGNIETAKMWCDLFACEWLRLHTLQEPDIEKEWMEKVRESS